MLPIHYDKHFLDFTNLAEGVAPSSTSFTSKELLCSFSTQLTQVFSEICRSLLTRSLDFIYLPFVFHYLFILPLLLIGCTRLRLRKAGGCAWAFYDPSSSSFHPVKCLTTINLNSPPWKIASTMRWLLICEEASRWSSVIPRASPTRQQREILI